MLNIKDLKNLDVYLKRGNGLCYSNIHRWDEGHGLFRVKSYYFGMTINEVFNKDAFNKHLKNNLNHKVNKHEKIEEAIEYMKECHYMNVEPKSKGLILKSHWTKEYAKGMNDEEFVFVVADSTEFETI